MRPALAVLIAGSLLALAACDTRPKQAEAQAAAAPNPALDPDAPKPGTQAAEAIGLDAPSEPPRR